MGSVGRKVKDGVSDIARAGKRYINTAGDPLDLFGSKDRLRRMDAQDARKYISENPNEAEAYFESQDIIPAFGGQLSNPDGSTYGAPAQGNQSQSQGGLIGRIAQQLRDGSYGAAGNVMQPEVGPASPAGTPTAPSLFNRPPPQDFFNAPSQPPSQPPARDFSGASGNPFAQAARTAGFSDFQGAPAEQQATSAEQQATSARELKDRIMQVQRPAIQRIPVKMPPRDTKLPFGAKIPDNMSPAGREPATTQTRGLPPSLIKNITSGRMMGGGVGGNVRGNAISSVLRNVSNVAAKSKGGNSNG